MALLRRTKKQDDLIVDRVTGAFNRRQLDADIAAGLDTSDQPTASLLISVDDFPTYTGKQGVASGDQVLERVSWVIMATVRTTDVVYRHARDAFCVLLPATTDADAVAVAGRIRSNVERMPLLAESRVTVSVGVATGSGTDLASTIQRADDALASGAPTGVNQVFTERRADRAAMPAPAPAPVDVTPPDPADSTAAAPPARVGAAGVRSALPAVHLNRRHPRVAVDRQRTIGSVTRPRRHQRGVRRAVDSVREAPRVQPGPGQHHRTPRSRHHPSWSLQFVASIFFVSSVTQSGVTNVHSG